MSTAAVLRLARTERTISLTLTLPRPAFRLRRRPAPKGTAARTDRPLGLNEAAFYIQRPLI